MNERMQKIYDALQPEQQKFLKVLFDDLSKKDKRFFVEASADGDTWDKVSGLITEDDAIAAKHDIEMHCGTMINVRVNHSDQ